MNKKLSKVRHEIDFVQSTYDVPIDKELYKAVKIQATPYTTENG